MQPEQYQQLKEWFDLHVEETLQGEHLNSLAAQKKLSHSRRVAADCRWIAEAICWPQSEVCLAEAIGLVHDIGRFSQIKQYGSLDDSITIDHGELGWEVLSKQMPAVGLSSEEQEQILTCVRYHNRRSIPADIAGETLSFLHLVRDSDKLDIYTVFSEEMRRDAGVTFKKLWPKLLDSDELTPCLLDEYLANRDCSYRNVQTLADFTLVMLSWSYALHYQATYKLLAKRGSLAAVLEFLPKTPQVQSLANEALAYVDSR